ncbi:MAG: N-acetylmuramoyl-L-alanine amidase-like domain-containing protein [Gemmatimonadota bacterium]
MVRAGGTLPTERNRLTSAPPAALLVLAIVSCGGEQANPSPERSGSTAEPQQAVQVTMQPEDSVIFAERMAWAQEQRLDTLPMGETVAALGRTFVGAPYTPATLELEGPERLIVNLRELDCVTFVENMLALARVLHAGTPDFDSFKHELVRIRYRDGVLTGYPSRLHYFSEWIANNEEKGIVDDVTAELGGVPDTGDISFMTRHVEAYRQFSDTAVAAAIGVIELELSGRERFYIPENAIAGVAGGIRDGDIIAATSTLDGLDVAHTGIALRVGDELHLMHAPLVGSHVQISERPLAERLQGIEAQDGIMVARPSGVVR